MTAIIQVLTNDAFWNALSSIATTGATITALYLAYRDKIKRMNVVLIWDHVEQYQPVLFVSNTGNQPIPIKTISLCYKRKEFFHINVLETSVTNGYSQYFIPANTSQKINLNPNEIRITGVKNQNVLTKLHPPKIKIVIEDMSGKRYVFRQEMEETKMNEAIFGAALYS